MRYMRASKMQPLGILLWFLTTFTDLHSISYTIWYGLRYAAAPTGKLRWRPPAPIEQNNNYSRSEVISAKKQGNICIQGTPAWELEWKIGNYSSIPVQSGYEDCLLLDVLVPKNPVSDALPVMVQIHGGGYTQGNSEYYPGFEIVEHSQGSLIYVSIQYRLGPWGFLASENIRKDGVPNAGLLDQRAALEWIQRHISSFGGDPDRVTIIGGSAGGGSVAAQMIMYGGVENPPFWAAVAGKFPPKYLVNKRHSFVHRISLVAAVPSGLRSGSAIFATPQPHQLYGSLLFKKYI